MTLETVTAQQHMDEHPDMKGKFPPQFVVVRVVECPRLGMAAESEDLARGFLLKCLEVRRRQRMHRDN